MSDVTATNKGNGLPGPPYQVESSKWARLLVRFDPAAVREFLPAQLRPVQGATGGYVLTRATGGWGFGPWGKCVSWIDVEGYDAPDGTAGRFFWLGYVSGAGVEYSRSVFSTDYMPGDIRVEKEGARLNAVGGPAARPPYISVALERSRSRSKSVGGVQYCLGRHPSGSLSFSPVPFSGDIFAAEVIDVDFGEPMEGYPYLVPAEVLSASVAGRVSWTYGFARAESSAATRSIDAFVDLLGHIGRGALVVDEAGLLVAKNTSVVEMLSTDLVIVGAALKATTDCGSDAISRIRQLVRTTISSRSVSGPIAIDRSGEPPALAIAFPGAAIQAVDDSTGRQPESALVLLSDPRGSNSSVQSGQLLELLGLTPAEARIASLSGVGLSRRQVADRLNLTEATVRVTLTNIYDKLGATRQRELVRIVSYIEQSPGGAPAQN